jgi:Flp pilus assembly pilin Flp
LRKQAQGGAQDFIGLRDTAKQLNDAFNEIDASRIQRATALVQIFKVRGARSFLTLTKEIEEFDRLFNTIAATEIRTELLDEGSLKKALDAQDSFASAFGITFEKLVDDATKVPEGLDKALTDAKLDERARDIFRNLRDEVTDLGLDSESVEAVLSDFLPLDAVKDFRKIIQLTDQDFESFLANINATNQDAQTLNKTLLNNLGSALEELQDTVITTFIRIGGAIAERLDLTNVVRGIQQAIEDFSSGGGVEQLADKLVNVFKTIGTFFKGIKTGFSQVFTPEIVENLKNAFVRNFGIIQNEAGNLGVVLGRVLGSMAKGGAELITRALNSDLIENASNAFKKIGSVLERLGPVIGAVATGFVLLSPILGPLFYIGGKLASVFGFLISGILGSGKAIKGLVGGASKLTGGFGGVIGKLTGVGATATKTTAGTAGLLGKLSGLGSSISGIFGAIGSALGVSAGVAAGIVVAVIGTVIGFINQVRQNFLGLGDDFKTIFGALWELLKSVGAALKENFVEIGAMLKPIWEGIKDTFNGLGKILGAIVASVIHPFAEGLRNSGAEGLKAGEIIKGAITLMLAPLRIALTILGSLLKAVGAVINFVADIIAGFVELGFAFQDAFRRFRTEGFSAFSQVGEVAKKIGISILKSFIGAIDSIINIFIDLINEAINIAKKIPLLNKVIDKNFKIDKNVLGGLLGFSKEAEKTVDKIKKTQDVLTETPNINPGVNSADAFLPGLDEGNTAGLGFSTSAIEALSANQDKITGAAVDPFINASSQATDLGYSSMLNYSEPFGDRDTLDKMRANVMSAFPTPAQAKEQGIQFGKFFFEGLAGGMYELSGIFQQNILPLFTTMNQALQNFISVFLRNLFVLKSVPPFLLNLATSIYRIFVGGWQSTFNAIADITEKIINTMQTNLAKFYNNLVTIINRLISEYNRAANVLARDITRTRKYTRSYTDSKGNRRTKSYYKKETLYKGVNIPKLAQFSNVKLDKLELERSAIPSSPYTVNAGGFSVNIENMNASSETDKKKLFSEIDKYIAVKLGGLVRL